MGKLKPARAVHPGRIVARELNARGWTKNRLAKLSGLPLESIAQIIDGEMDITADVAEALGHALGVPPALWENLERNYLQDAAHIRPATPPVTVSFTKAAKHVRQKTKRRTKAS